MDNDRLKKFKSESIKRVNSYKKNKSLQEAAHLFHKEIIKVGYSYNFSWLGVPIIKDPQDIQLRQEIIWEVKPDLVIETGIAWGGSVIFSASMLEIMEACRIIKDGKVIGIDIGIDGYSKEILTTHPLGKRIIAIEGSSVDPNVIKKIKQIAKGKKKVLVILDSNHTHEHVLTELKAYAPFVSKGSYFIVEDTGIEDEERPAGDRPWGKGNNPKTAVLEFLKRNRSFKIDKNKESKILFTNAPDGLLKRIR